MKLSDKEALGVYLLLREQRTPIDESMARLAKRLEDQLYRDLTVEEVEDLEAVYRTMDDTPQSDRGA